MRLPLAHAHSPSSPATERPVHRADVHAPLVHMTDRVVVEEPLEIRVAGEPIAVTMRTPGDDVDLAIGFLFTETTISSIDDIARVDHGSPDDRDQRNVIDLVPSEKAAIFTERAKRSFYAASSCGVCGKATIDAIHVKVPRIERATDPTTFAFDVLASMPQVMRGAQSTFEATGGLHAAAIFDERGELVVVREDVGRHNATDKSIGHMVRERRVPCRGKALLVSGRAGFEIVQKAAVAQIPLVAAVSAPSSLAIDLADRLGVTLVAFLRPPKASIYTHEWRVI